MEQREIKFRALVVADGVKQMLLFNLPKMDNGLWAWPMDNDVHHIDDYLSPLMQYTGLKDKNGVEIYEGDIITPSNYKNVRGKDWAGFRCEVIEYEGMFSLMPNGKLIQEYSPLYISLISAEKASNHFEVIGNIHENPSLLTK